MSQLLNSASKPWKSTSMPNYDDLVISLPVDEDNYHVHISICRHTRIPTCCGCLFRVLCQLIPPQRNVELRHILQCLSLHYFAW
jgi:hypothetical protein